MFLTKEEERILEGKQGFSYKKAMEILEALGDLYGAEKLVPIESAQISGVSFKTIGDAGLAFLRDMSDAKVEVPTTINPAGMDLVNWEELGFPREFAEKQKEIISYYKKMGAEPECTCTPYLVGNKPSFGDHLAWSESSAVSYANSVLGARTNREGGASALASSIIGKTPKYGYHLKENRAPDIGFKINEEIKRADFGALGKKVGRLIEDKTPFFEFSSSVNLDELKLLGAAMASTGAVALYHVKNVTPESKEYDEPNEFIEISKDEISDEYINDKSNIDLVALGCPHLSFDELKTIYDYLKNKEIKKELWLFVARSLREEHQELINELEKKDVKIVSDTCMVVSPLKEMGYSKIMVDSGKASTYLPSLGDVEVVFSDLIDCLEVAVGGD